VFASQVVVAQRNATQANATQANAAERNASDAAMVQYADAANYQTGGAFDVAIEAWNKFLSQHPEHPMAPQAAHYLGVCYMQKENPDYAAATRAFRRALQEKEYDLRQESLANLGWCLYAASGDGEKRDPDGLNQAIDVFRSLQSEYPKSEFLDRAYFYSGEAAYGLGDSKRAIAFYDKLLAMQEAKDSPLRCDALYARGVAQEELKQFDAALSSYRQLLGSCERGELISDVHLRVGDLLVMKKDYQNAIESFQSAFDSTEASEDRSYALFRQAFSLVQLNRPNEAAAKYQRISEEFPESPYAGSALLAAAQSSYRGGDLDQAAEQFRQVLNGKNNSEAATEAAHWLARIEITRGKPAEAARIAEQQIQRGVEGSFATDLRLDLAEALSMDPERMEESLKLFTETYRQAPNDPLAPRALYNAAFSSLQLNQPKQALELASEFITEFPQDTLLPDVRFIAAESHLMLGQAEQAADTYQKILASTGRDNPQRPLWLLRAAATSNAAGRFEATIDQLTAELNLFEQPAQKAEAYLLIGQAQMRSGQPEAAVQSMAASRKADPASLRAAQAQLQQGQAQLRAGNPEAARATWKQLIDSDPDAPLADQARYQLAQLASNSEQYDQAVRYYDEILQSKNRTPLIPYAQYGKGWALMQIEEFEPALESLEPVVASEAHPLRNDALLARGIARRNLGQFDDARRDLQQYLEVPPVGTNLGHALYELALIDQTDKQPGRAAAKLERLVKEVPEYPSMDKVLYELGWSLQESGNAADAVKYFTSMINEHPDTPLAADAAYFIGQQHYNAEDWEKAASQFAIAADKASEKELSEKALYRWGWSEFKGQDYEAAEQAFAKQAAKHADGRLALDALMMVGECRFKRADFEAAVEGFDKARNAIRDRKEDAKTIRDPAERRVRELVFLHGGQSEAQLKRWNKAIEWYDELRERFPSTQYLPQVFYETGFAYQQLDDQDNALKFFQEVADNYRNVLAARARFMIGEIYFAKREFDKAIPEFQRVMYGFGAEKAPSSIKNWQAKSGFEAGRCGELLVETAKSPTGKQKARKIATDFFEYVIDKHPDHELAAKSRDRIEALRK
jgi:TolA-binding protein